MENASSESRIATADLPQAIERAIAESIGLTEHYPVSVIAEYPAHLPIVQGEQGKLARVIASLVASAARAIQQGEIRVKAEIISAGQPRQRPSQDGAPEGPKAQVSISIPPFDGEAEAAQSFAESIDRAPGMGSEEVEKPMLELSTCRVEVERFGGSLWVEPPGDAGLRLAFALPLRAAQSARADVSELQSIVEAHLPNGKEPVRTLLAMLEDAALLELLTQVLGEAGYRVIGTQDGGEVLALARNEKPDLVLLDMMARDPAALDVAMVLKQDHRTLDVPVLFLSSMADPQVGEVRLGAASFLVRPVGTGALISTIQTVIDSGIAPSGRVLVVEGDEVARETIVMMIQAHGYRVTEAASPEEALALAERIPPDLALVNASMAQERDYWLLRGLRRIGHDFDILVLAEAFNEADQRAVVDRGASGYSETGKLAQLLDEMRKRRDSG